MKKIIKIMTVFSVASFLLGLFANTIEKKSEKKRREENREKDAHHFFGPYEAYLKRPLDFVLVLFALVFLAPLYLVIAMSVRVKLGSPVLFLQERPTGKSKP